MNERIKSLYEYLLDKKCKDIAIYDVSHEKLAFNFVFIVTCADCNTNKSLANQIMTDFNLEFLPEGYNKGEWIIYDFDDIILHMFVPALREKYNLDKLWQTKKINLAKI